MARQLLQGEHGVGRVIARPFVGSPVPFRELTAAGISACRLWGPTILDRLVDTGCTVYGIGKIPDIFAGRGVTNALPAHSNAEVRRQC